MVVYWHLTLLGQGQVCFHMHLYGRNFQNFKWLLLWSRWANVAQISFGASLGQGNERLLKWLLSINQPPCPYMVKSFKNLLLQNRESLVAESLLKSSGMAGLPKLLKEWSYIDIWPFYIEVVCFPVHVYVKNVENFKWLLWSLWASDAQILFGASLGQGNERLLK